MLKEALPILSMPLVHRRAAPHNEMPLHGDRSNSGSDDDGERKPPRFGFLHLIACLAVLLVVPRLLFSSWRQQRLSFSLSSVEEKGYKVLQRNFGSKKDEASLLVKLKQGKDGVILAGPHKLELQLVNKCLYPRFWMRLTGDALVRVDLKEETKGSLWQGSFSLPMAGSYQVDARWYGCSPDQSSSWVGVSEPLEIISSSSVVDTVTLPRSSVSSLQPSLFSDGAWVADNAKGGDKRIQYIWKRQTDIAGEQSKIIRLDDTSAPVVVESTTREPGGFYLFHDLGNYELVCFAGSQTMSDIRDKFLALRPYLFPRQRPFKFHYYNITDLVRPDRKWTLENKQRFRKCKHILVSVDEMDKPVSQAEYREQMTTFVGHLLKLMNDDTFPIWIFSVNEPPMQATNCYSPSMQRTTDHPCNDVLKDLFRKNTFPGRVHLLDNTDLSLAQFGENRDDILAIIALRVFVLVGKRVAEWRAVGQKGMIDGLHRNNVVEPNFELVPYEGWASS